MNGRKPGLKRPLELSEKEVRSKAVPAGGMAPRFSSAAVKDCLIGLPPLGPVRERDLADVFPVCLPTEEPSDVVLIPLLFPFFSAAARAARVVGAIMRMLCVIKHLLWKCWGM